MKNNKKHTWFKTIKELWNFLVSDKKRFIGAMFLTFFKTAISIFLSIAIGILVQDAFLLLTDPDPVKVNDAWLRLLYGCLIIFVGYAIFFICYLIAAKIVIKVSYGLGYTIRDLIFMKLHKVPYSLIQQKMSGDLMSRTTTDVNALAINMSVGVSNMFTSPAIVIGVYVGLFILSPYLALIMIVMFVIIIIGSYYFAKLSAPKYAKMQQEMGNMTIEVEEQISNRKVTKLFNLQDQIYKQFAAINEKQRNVTTKAEINVNFIWPWNDVIETIMFAVLYAISIVFAINQIPSGSVIFNQITVGTLTSFMLLARQANGEASNALRLIGFVQKMFVAAERSLEILKFPDYIDNGKLILNDIQGDVEFKNVDFSYEKDKPILKDISFKVPKHTVTAIVGPTGSGKTTIVNLISRFYEIDNGTITIDNIDIRNISQKNLCSNISVVLQDSFLFSESIRDNIAYGNPTATYEEIKQAAINANAHRFIEMLPLKYETIISERINDFSNGEIQLLALARAFLSPAKILILDEATSSVDTKTENDIQDAMMRLIKTKTVIIIAHRLSTIVNANQIIVIHNGKILDQGTHQELLNHKGFYYDLYQANATFE